MDFDDLRADIPALSDAVYCNWGASGPSPRRVVDAIESTLEYHEYESPGAEGMYPAAWDVFDATRETVAEFVGASPAEIALTQSTTDAINRVATAMDWSADDRVVITDLEHAAGILPWRRLEREVGIEVSVLETELGAIDPDAFADLVDGATLACFSAVDWLFGRRQPVAELVEAAHEAGALALVDAVQVPGQMTFDVDEWGADVVAAAGHKWLMGPWGAGFLYVDEAVVDTFRPASLGYRGVENPYDVDFDYEAGAKRFEVGTTSPAPFAGLAEAIDLVGELGIDAIEAEIERLTDRFKAGLPADRLLSPSAYHTGLVSFEDDDPESTVERLADAGVFVRSLPRPNTVRVSLHAANTDDDVDSVLDAL